MKKRIAFLSIIVLTVLSIFIVNAISGNPSDYVILNETGETEHGNCDLTVNETHLEEVESGYMGQMELNVDPGYFVKRLDVTFNENPDEDPVHLDLGFEAGSEHGGFFRVYEDGYTILESLYQFKMPNNADADHKVTVDVEYAKKSPIDVTYTSFESDIEDNIRSIQDMEAFNYDKLVENYMDGDIVLPDDCLAHGCLLKLDFKTQEVYDEYRAFNVVREGHFWIKGEARIDHDNYLEASEDMCDNTNKVCYALVRKGFKDKGSGTLSVGYTTMNLFTSDSVSFEVKADVDNFDDLLHETGSSMISFTNSNKNNSIQLFYGTKKLYLTLKTPSPLIIVPGSENHSGSVREMINVTGSGYGYSTSYNNGVVTVTIDSYYQDRMVLELNILSGMAPVFDGKVNLELLRFAFAGNGGELLEVDEIGRNCNEEHNDNTCDEGIYYSTQYRGVFSAFYVDKYAMPLHLDTALKIDNVLENEKQVNLYEVHDENYYMRDTNFNPHAIALFYDKNDMIVEMKDFDLNSDVTAEGYVDKNTFNNIFNGYQVNHELDQNYYIYFDRDHETQIKNIKAFDNHIDGSIMHDIVLIGKEEAKEKGIVKIGLFLLNGELEEDTIPPLTYGVGEGRIMEIRGDE